MMQEFDPEDLLIEVRRSSGQGGQHVPRMSEGVSITHKPSGIVVYCDSERSTHKNKEAALKVLSIGIETLEKIVNESGPQEG